MPGPPPGWSDARYDSDRTYGPGARHSDRRIAHSDRGLAVPAAGADADSRPPPRLPPSEFRLNQEIRWCDLQHNMAGYSATNGNAIWVHDNNFFDNALGLTTDVVTGAGHPGFPGDSQLIEHNNFYSNNFNLFAPDSDVKPAFPFPSGTGMWIAGGNHRAHGTVDRNGTDFWWDAAPGARGNCWWGNQSPTGITSSPLLPLPNCDNGQNPDSSVGTGSENELELGLCAMSFETGNFDQPNPCPWLTPPSDPDGRPSGGGAPPAQPMTNAPVAPASATQAPADVPLGQVMCSDWNAAKTNTDRQTLADRIQAFVGGSVNGATTLLGHGPELNDGRTAKLFDYWCRGSNAQNLLLYKLYSFSADFQASVGKSG